MKRTLLFFGLIGFCLLTFSQNQICVDGSWSGSENGTPTNPYKTIHAAIDVASNGDIIKVAKGTYSEAIQISQKKVQLLGGYAGSGDFNIANPESNVTIINGTSAAPSILIYIDTQISGNLIINGFTIRNGQRGIELSGGWSGYLNNITIENNIIENNGSLEPDEWGGHRHGGGIGLEGNNITIQNNIIRNNISMRGAAIGVTDDQANFNIVNNRIENNTGHDDHAGGVSICGTGTISRNVFRNNVAAAPLSWGWGGALLIFASNPENNTTVTLSFNIYSNNSAPTHGGAIFIDDGATVFMENELIFNNSSGDSGSAIYVDADYLYNPSVLHMDNCTVFGNTCSGASMFVQGSTAHVQNCIFWNNGSDFQAMDDGGTSATLTVNYTLAQQGFAGTGNFSSDPLFADVSNGDFHIKSKNGRYISATGQWFNDAVSSPAIDAGNPTSDYSNEPAPNGGRVNLGCYGNTPEASKSDHSGITNPGFGNTNVVVTPNPTSGEFSVFSFQFSDVSSEMSVVSIEILDIAGRIVHRVPCTVNREPCTMNRVPCTVNREPFILNRPTVEIDISHLSNGIYFVKVGNEMVKLVKK
ncbi:MAG: right-handed parallel beta-helix repeat-containing protein [Marinilabiliaceae bacterium]|nr:right-handed parallel beta-helix repeat-containing protein [Marinilabiliaceae bacterium]